MVPGLPPGASWKRASGVSHEYRTVTDGRAAASCCHSITVDRRSHEQKKKKKKKSK
jgi:hypothetical protein